MTTDTPKPATAPWLAEPFTKAYAVLSDLDEAGRFDLFTPAVLSDEQLKEFMNRLRLAQTGLPEKEAMPLELLFLKEALWMIYFLLEHEIYLRQDNEEHRNYCAKTHADKFGGNEQE